MAFSLNDQKMTEMETSVRSDFGIVLFSDVGCSTEQFSSNCSESLKSELVWISDTHINISVSKIYLKSKLLSSYFRQFLEMSEIQIHPQRVFVMRTSFRAGHSD